MVNGYDLVLSGRKYSITPILLKMYKNSNKKFMRNTVIN